MDDSDRPARASSPEISISVKAILEAEQQRREQEAAAAQALLEAKRIELEQAREAFKETQRLRDKELVAENEEKARQRQSSGAWSTLLF